MVFIRNSSKDGRFARLSFGDGDGGSITPWGSLFSAGASIISAGIGARAQKKAAKTYLQGVQDTNKTNLQLAQEQRDWDLAQWNRENEYNSAAAQMQRWQSAGLSPQSFVGAGSPGEAASLQSPDMANQVAPGDMSGYAQGYAQSIQQGIQGATDAALKWRQMELNQQQLNLDKEALANQTKEVESKVKLNDALTEQAKANKEYLNKLAKLTDSQRYKVDAELDLAVQKWEQLAKLFPETYKEAQERAEISRLERVLNSESMQDQIKAYALANNKTEWETRNLIFQAIYWMYQGKEGEFQVSTQPLRFDILNWNQQQLKFNLDFDRNTRYSQLQFENYMKGIHAFAEVGQLSINVVSEVRNWVHPGSFFGNTLTKFGRDAQGRVTSIDKSFTPYGQ